MLPRTVQIAFGWLLLSKAASAFPGECTSTLSARVTPAQPSPQPTSPPKYKADLVRRDIVNYCGYITEDLDQPFGCSAGYTCAVNTDYNVAGCCSDTASCALFTTCVQSWAASGAYDPQAITCSDPDRYCFTGFFIEGGVSPSAFGCSDTSRLNPLIYPTYPGGPLPAVTAFIGNSISSDTTDTDLSTSSIPSPESGSRPKPKKKTNVGAIAGGVVGGVVALAVVVVGIVMLLIRRRNKKNNSAYSYPNAGPYGGPQQPYQPVPQGPPPPNGQQVQAVQPPMQQVEAYKVDPTVTADPVLMSNKQNDAGAVHRSPSPQPVEPSPVHSPRLSSAVAATEPPAPASPTAPAPAYSPGQSYSSTFGGSNGPYEVSSQAAVPGAGGSSGPQQSLNAVAPAAATQDQVFEAPNEPRNYGPATFEVASDRPVYEAPNERRTYELGTER